MLSARYQKYTLQFKSPVLTSRGQMAVKNGYFLFISDGNCTGIGECSFIEGLSCDDLENYESKLAALCRSISEEEYPPSVDLKSFPSLQFGYEMAIRDLEQGGNKLLFENDFTTGKASIPINGLVWMGSKDFMFEQIRQKLEAGFNCVKIKVGAIDFEEELMLLNFTRQKFPADVIELRLDANGAFNSDNAMDKLNRLAKFHIHSIEQPVKQGQYSLMEKLCLQSPIPIALDEELIDIKGISKEQLLQQLKPQFLILKPSLLGGWDACNEWIDLAAMYNTGWWATSALESNIGLNAIAQWVFTKKTEMVQGLGTGELYTDNISSPLFIQKGRLHHKENGTWGNVDLKTENGLS